MRKLALLVGLVLLAGIAAQAQEYPKAEFYAGYSYWSDDNDPPIGRVSVPAGFSVNFAGNVNEHIGIVGDFSGHFKSGFTAYAYTGGVRYNTRGEKVNGFFHGLAGGATLSNGASLNGFAVGFGGGADVSATDRIAVRVVQAEWVLTRFAGIWDTTNFRIGAGVVFKIQ